MGEAAMTRRMMKDIVKDQPDITTMAYSCGGEGRGVLKEAETAASWNQQIEIPNRPNSL